MLRSVLFWVYSRYKELKDNFGAADPNRGPSPKLPDGSGQKPEVEPAIVILKQEVDMKIILFAFFALFSTTAFAHPGHVSMVAGHTHSFAELAMFGLVPGLAALAFMVFLRRRARG